MNYNDEICSRISLMKFTGTYAPKITASTVIKYIWINQNFAQRYSQNNTHKNALSIKI